MRRAYFGKRGCQVMFGKIKVASGLLAVLVVFCLFQLVTEGLGFWSLSRTHDDVGNLSDIALKQVNAVNKTTQHLMDARINLSRAGTRMVRGGTEPTEIVQHAREQIAARRQVVQRVPRTRRRPATKTGAHGRAAGEIRRRIRRRSSELVQYLDAGNIQAFLDQPTQGFQDRYLAEQQNFVNFGDAAGRAYLASIDHALTPVPRGGHRDFRGARRGHRARACRAAPWRDRAARGSGPPFRAHRERAVSTSASPIAAATRSAACSPASRRCRRASRAR